MRGHMTFLSGNVKLSVGGEKNVLEENEWNYFLSCLGMEFEYALLDVYLCVYNNYANTNVGPRFLTYIRHFVIYCSNLYF